MRRVLETNGYKKSHEKYFSYVKNIDVKGVQIEVEVDFLAGFYNGTTKDKRSQHASSIKLLKASGGDYAFNDRFHGVIVPMEGKRSDGAIEYAEINVIDVLPFIVMKTSALMRRNKPKDAYDIYFVLKNYQGGIENLTKEVVKVQQHEVIKKMLKNMKEKFKTPEHVGVQNVIKFIHPMDDSKKE